MKVVLLHDWLTGFRGGEWILEAFCEMFPDAPLYTLIYDKGKLSPAIENREIRTSFLQNIPGIFENYRKFLPLFPSAIGRMKIVEDADLVLSSSHCVIKGLLKPSGSKHISYIHSPMRYIYDQFGNYFGKGTNPIVRASGHICRPYLQTWDYISNQNVDHFISNSEFVKKRIEFFYHRPATVINPFVDLDSFREVQKSPPEREDFYLSVGAFAPNKKIDLAVGAFNILGKKLKIVGSGQDEDKLKKMAKSNIEFLGRISREEIVSLMARAKGFIFPGVEDFGITPLEVLAAGTPLIAYRAGGVLETLNDNVAKFFNEPTVESLIEAVREYDQKDFERKILFDRAECFSKDIFKTKIKGFIDSVFEDTP
ncbi:MAG: glycosyltransferase [Bacteriovoracaceae bacterium]|jgi:glycosyltransferase involved in cell wall biosynthesis|nr:glycosyltransferase [Bacteriovoracaceae bacterium]